MRRIILFLFLIALSFVGELVFAADGILQSSSGTTVTTPSSGISNLWICTTIPFRASSWSPSTTTNFFPFYSVSAPLSIEAQSQMLFPTNGYLTNLVVGFYDSFPATTNITVYVITNNYGTAGIASGLACVLQGGQSKYTNDAVHSIILSPGIGVGLLGFSSAPITSTHDVTGTVEWWHQSP